MSHDAFAVPESELQVPPPCFGRDDKLRGRSPQQRLPSDGQSDRKYDSQPQLEQTGAGGVGVDLAVDIERQRQRIARLLWGYPRRPAGTNRIQK